ncbi:MAG: UxaA family hydrolase, partial [Oscillibacter sp.]
ILPASVCASDTTRIVAQQLSGAVTFNNQNGCSQVASDQQLTMDVMAGYAANPNVYGTVIVSLGCENCQMDLVAEAIAERTNKPMKQVIIQEVGGTLKAIDLAVRYAKEMIQAASLLQKEPFPMSELIVGTECGGSDPTSGLAANPLIGQLSDLLVADGGTSILSETTELIGAEHILARRAATPEVHDRILGIVHRYEAALQLVGEEVRQGNPSPGNKAGGLTTLEEKSLGCIHKGGHTPVNAVYDYAKQVQAKSGLVLMDTP